MASYGSAYAQEPRQFFDRLDMVLDHDLGYAIDHGKDLGDKFAVAEQVACQWENGGEFIFELRGQG